MNCHFLGFPSADIANFAVRIVELALAYNCVGYGIFASSGKVGYSETIVRDGRFARKLFRYLSNSYSACMSLLRYIAISCSERIRRGWHLLRGYKLLCAGRKKELG